MNSDSGVEQVLEMCTPQVRKIVEALRRLVREAAPEATERGYTGWRSLMYTHNKMFCYIGPLKDSVNLGFHRGVDLLDTEGLLKGTGKGMRHVKIRSVEDIRADAFSRLVKEAYRLDD